MHSRLSTLIVVLLSVTLVISCGRSTDQHDNEEPAASETMPGRTVPVRKPTAMPNPQGTASVRDQHESESQGKSAGQDFTRLATTAKVESKGTTGHKSEAELVAERLTHQNALGMMFFQKVEEWATRRIATYDEAIELKIARCMAVEFFKHDKEFDRTTVDVDGVAKMAAIKMTMWAEAQKPEVSEKAGDVAQNLLKMEVFLREKKQTFAGEPFDTLEARYHTAMSATAAANTVRLATLIRQSIPASFTKANADMQNRLREVLEKDPDLVKKLATLPAISDELKKARESIKVLFDEARKKK